MRRGDIVTTIGLGDYGKPRPALVIQSDLFMKHTSMTILLITSELRDAPLFRIEVKPTTENGLRKISQVMIDKAVTVPCDKLGPVFGHLDDSTMLAINKALAVWLGFV
ncbi:type II toxin-antitoxin system PemK/MazF family toxin [Candidatus Magnetomonas plexicatena]|uniref:type II toxin-antitoxin system PemK/MazF family toxin n=1 Tax=Candidatus Magnetomonas plexicatena TaxID=2552947 RepID=UPI001C788678|nr:type II toxin-antitoxin system PemK/MazF family toxin [Nitrospirales bacterium LBB_01]